LILLSTVFLGGFTTGWTGYAPLADQNVLGMDSYLMGFALIGLSIALSGLNMIATILTKRAPEMPLSRMPVFVWSVLVTSFLGALAAPALIAAVLMEMFSRTYQATFFIPAGGGSPYLWENLFWFFGHPEVYIFVVPAFGLVMEMLPAFARRPLWDVAWESAAWSGSACSASSSGSITCLPAASHPRCGPSTCSPRR